MNWVGQQLTGAPLWLQMPIVVLASALLCAILALVLLRGIDIAGALTYRFFNPGQQLQAKGARFGHVPVEHKVVVHTEPTGRVDESVSDGSDPKRDVSEMSTSNE